MKRLLLLLMVVFLSREFYCQKVSIVARGGVALNSSPFFTKDKLSNASGLKSFLPGLKFMISIRHFQFGIGLDYCKYKYQYNTTSGIQQDKLTMVASIPVTCPYVFLNHKIKIFKSYLFYGIDLGYTFTGKKLNQVTSGTSDAKSWSVGSGANGIAAGIHAGYNQHLVKKWSLQIEAGLRYLFLRSSYTAFDASGNHYEIPEKPSALIVPVTLGVNYTF